MTEDFTRTFSASEMARIKVAAEARIRDHPVCVSVDASRLRNEALGIASEWATREWLGLPVEPALRLYGSGGDGGTHDLVLPDGRRVEVKATVYPRGVLVFPPGQTFRADLAVLCIRLAPATVRAVGYAKRSDWDVLSVRTDLGRGCGPQWVMEQGSLRAFGELVQEVMQTCHRDVAESVAERCERKSDEAEEDEARWRRRVRR